MADMCGQEVGKREGQTANGEEEEGSLRVRKERGKRKDKKGYERHCVNLIYVKGER